MKDAYKSEATYAYEFLATLSKEYEGAKTNEEKRVLLASLFGWYMHKKGQLDYIEERKKDGLL